MARYSEMYAKAEAELKLAKAELAAMTQQKEMYRTYIVEREHVGDFMLWWAQQQDFGPAVMETIERCFSPTRPEATE